MAGNRNRGSQQPDDDVFIIEPEVPMIDLCDSPIAGTSSRTQSSRKIGTTSRTYDLHVEFLDKPGSAFPKPKLTLGTPPPRKLSTSKKSTGARERNVKSESSLSCPICLDSLRQKNPMSTTCGHIFCKSCINQAMKNAKQCPLCKKKLATTQIHPIFI